jgi:hypothetical protein
MDDLQSYVADLDACIEQFTRLAGDDLEWAANCVANLIRHMSRDWMMVLGACSSMMSLRMFGGISIV